MTQEYTELLAQIREGRKNARRSPYRRSKLEKYRAYILGLKKSGATLADIQFFLRTLASPSVSVDCTTIKRFIDKINDEEMNG